MLWSILICGIPERYHDAHGLLYSLLEKQSVARMQDVELLYLMDNRRRHVGAKRNDLLQLAKGEYISFIDDDDQVATDYVQKIYRAITTARKQDPPTDVICFPQRCTLSPQGVVHECSYSIEHYKRQPDKRRELVPGSEPNTFNWTGPPAHTMVWRWDIAKSSRFPAENFGEDVSWVDQCCNVAKTEMILNGEPLYFYNFDESKTATR